MEPDNITPLSTCIKGKPVVHSICQTLRVVQSLKPAQSSKNHGSFPPCPIHSNRIQTTAIKPDPYLSLYFYRVRVIQKHCSLLFICICRLNSCSPPCLLSALEEIVSSRLLEKLTVSSFSQFPITNFFIFKFVYKESDHIVLVCIESNSTAQEEFEELCFSFGIELDDVVSACISFSFWLLILKCLISLF